jgi:hypothetical protein
VMSVDTMGVTRSSKAVHGTRSSDFKRSSGVHCRCYYVVPREIFTA